MGIFALVLVVGYLWLVYPKIDNFDVSQKQCAVLNEFWQTKAQLDFTLTDEWNLGAFDCPSPESGMARALFFISELSVVIAGKQPKQTYYDWAKRLNPVFQKPFMFGLAGQTTFETGIIEINTTILAKNNWISIAGILVHELRHLEQGYNTHVPCLQNPERACDRRLEHKASEGGAYNYNMLFFDQIRNIPTATLYEKRLAKREMNRIFDQYFNEVATGSRDRFGIEQDK